MAKFEIPIKCTTRSCDVHGRPGYFHIWEYYSKPLPASNLIGGEPAGVYSQVFGIVEFSDGVQRIDPVDIKFTDEENASLCSYEKYVNEQKDLRRL